MMLRTELCRLTEALETEIKLAGGNDRQLAGCRCDLEMDSFVPISIRRVLATLVSNVSNM